MNYHLLLIVINSYKSRENFFSNWEWRTPHFQKVQIIPIWPKGKNLYCHLHEFRVFFVLRRLSPPSSSLHLTIICNHLKTTTSPKSALELQAWSHSSPLWGPPDCQHNQRNLQNTSRQTLILLQKGGSMGANFLEGGKYLPGKRWFLFFKEVSYSLDWTGFCLVLEHVAKLARMITSHR